QALGVCAPWTRPRAAGREVSWPGLSPDHLWARIHHGREPHAASRPRPRIEAVTRLARICTWYRGTRALRTRGTTPPGPRVCLCSPGPRERTRRSSTVTLGLLKPSGYITTMPRIYTPTVHPRI